MHNDFIQIQSLEGELKISHKKTDFGATVSTKELVLQKPHLNYHIMLKDIISIVPFNPGGPDTVTISNSSPTRNEIITIPLGIQHYKFYVRRATVYNRKGTSEIGPAEFILPILQELLFTISQYGGIKIIHTE